jgi:hypothetical protein
MRWLARPHGYMPRDHKAARIVPVLRRARHRGISRVFKPIADLIERLPIAARARTIGQVSPIISRENQKALAWTLERCHV